MVKKLLKKWMKPRRVGNPIYFQPARTWEQRDPFGVVAVFVPWNYPLQLALSPLITAIAAGNCVVIKAAEAAPAASLLLAKLVDEAFDSDHVSVLLGEADVAQELLACDLDFVFYTGSTAVGKIVGSSAAGRLIPHVLELGGKCPVIVDAAVDVEVAARRVLMGKFFNGGQTCFAPDFVVVHESVKEAFVEECERVINEIPWAGEMATVVNERHHQRLLGLIDGEALIEANADARDGGMKPTLVADADWASKVMQEEIFGPILPVLSYSNDREMVGKLRVLGSPLSLYLFSKNLGWCEAMMESLPSGAVCINDTMKQGSHLGLEFGGVGESGYGRYRGKAGFDAFTYCRPVVRRFLNRKDIFEILPPYGERLEVLKRFMK